LPFYKANVKKTLLEPRYQDGRPVSPNSISYFVTVWINERFDVSNQKTKERYPNLGVDEIARNELSKNKLYHEDKFEENSSEYMSLGIFKTVGSPFNGKNAYTFTEFGLRYLQYLET
jgi:hypothetical protein